MVLFPNAKINLGLHVIEKRADGFHNLETLFYPLSFCDVLEIVPAGETALSLSGLEVEGDAENNLCMKAYRLLREAFDLPPVAIYLHKVIPTGAGLGGGSSDAAHMLMTLNKQFKLQLTAAQLHPYAAALGSDCAFFLHRQPMLATGRGELLTPFPLDLKGKYIVLVKPPVFVCTAAAYAGIVPKQPVTSITEILQQPLAQWKNTLVNDFETTVFAKFPVLAQAKQQLYDAGAVYASMSGSGGALFGIFDDEVVWTKAKSGLEGVLFTARL